MLAQPLRLIARGCAGEASPSAARASPRPTANPPALNNDPTSRHNRRHDIRACPEPSWGASRRRRHEHRAHQCRRPYHSRWAVSVYGKDPSVPPEDYEGYDAELAEFEKNGSRYYKSLDANRKPGDGALTDEERRERARARRREAENRGRREATRSATSAWRTGTTTTKTRRRRRPLRRRGRRGRLRRSRRGRTSAVQPTPGRHRREGAGAGVQPAHGGGPGAGTRFVPRGNSDWEPRGHHAPSAADSPKRRRRAVRGHPAHQATAGAVLDRAPEAGELPRAQRAASARAAPGQDAAGRFLALVSDAGTPGVADPGADIAAACAEEGIAVFPIPGPSAAAAAVAMAGIPVDEGFTFCGFLPPKSGARRKKLETLRLIKGSLVAFVPPHKLVNTLKDCAEALGDRNCCVCREMTKVRAAVPVVFGFWFLVFGFVFSARARRAAMITRIMCLETARLEPRISRMPSGLPTPRGGGDWQRCGRKHTTKA